MEVPNYIKQAICDLAELNSEAKAKDEIIRHWLYKKGLVDDDFISVKRGLVDTYLDCVEVENKPIELIEFLEQLK